MNEPTARYFRVSTDQQEMQRQTETTAILIEKHGYKVIETFEDQGISGWKHNERPGFMRLLQWVDDGRIKVIVADSLSRFSRQDEYDFFELVAPRLKRAGVIIHTVYDGIIDFNEFSGFLLTAVKQNSNNQFSKTTSHNVLSGSMSKAKDGRNMGSVPYGYRSVMDEPGNPKSRHHLEIYEPEAEVVRWLFEQYAHHDVPMRHLCKSLNDRGLPAPGGGGHWQPGTVRGILKNKKYTGTQTYGKTARGRFHRNIDGKLTPHKPKPVSGKKHDIHKNAEETWTVKDGAHEAIISREQFDRVQMKLTENKSKPRKFTGSGGYVLSATVVCGACGKNMHPKKRKGAIYYQCPNEAGTCAYVSVREDWILGGIRLMLQEHRFKPEVYERHIAELTRKIEETKVQVDPKRIEKLESEIKAASKNILFLPEHIKADALEGINERKAELEKLQAQLRSDIDVGNLFKRTIDSIEQGMQKFRIFGREPELRDQEQEAGPTRTRAALLSWLKRVTIFWKRKPARGYEILGMECETQWMDVQKWPPEVAVLYRSVLTKARRTAGRRLKFFPDRKPCSRPGL